MQQRHHYERAFAEYLRSRRIPYIAVDEARKSLLPGVDGTGARGASRADAAGAIKSFDFVVYGRNTNMLVDIKGRRVRSAASGSALAATRLDSWATEEDLDALQRWESLFGPGFEAVLVFVYWCAAQPPDALFQEVFEHRGEWYALRSVRVCEYVRCMKPRSPRWRTVYVPPAAFERISQPFSASLQADPGPVEPLLETLG
jgi:hypothetical protein